MRDLLGMASTRAVRGAARAGRLLAVQSGRRWLFPALQFDGGTVLSGVAEVITAAGDASAWAVLQFLIEGDEGLGDDRPIDLLRCGGPLERVIRFAGKLAD